VIKATFQASSRLQSIDINSVSDQVWLWYISRLRQLFANFVLCYERSEAI